MKKQNATNKLAFNKVAVVELNDNQMNDVDGGTTPVCTVVVSYLVATILAD
ncbi:class I lanthipeptide [Flavobacterium poyangense]|uniref:class I lanthipeptide n=1 Tax=Flavobacterium poyangense TaxID=2204302 RepID=UPI001422F3F7|nr:class I lanthipeptide [Flavobacterium sp. JXAS1]